MSDQPFIPRKTADKMAAPAAAGGRHQQALEIAISLIGQGISSSAVFAQLRSMYPPDKTDKELEDIVRYAVDRNPTPAGGARRQNDGFRPPPHQPRAQSAPKPARTPGEHASWWLGGLELTEEQTAARSPIKIQEKQEDSCRLFLEMLYGEDEFVNIVVQFTETEAGKANPQGSGKTMTRLNWCDWIGKKGVPRMRAGAWVRPNPTAEVGSGVGGAITDKDITNHRFLLIESDVLPLPVQFALYSKLKLPFATILSSGGKSVHAWVRLDAPSDEVYREQAKRILTALEPFGIDQTNKNPSRLSRLVGAHREIQAAGDGIQRLYYLNGKAGSITESQLKDFEDSLALPALDEKPLKPLIRDAIGRYEDLFKNQGKLGVPTGIDRFDRDTGGLKPGHFIVIAATTGGGKSTLALNWVDHALKQGIGVALFSIEMDRDEICDNLVSMNVSVDRNKFNTGCFSESDFPKMVSGMGKIAELPLWIYDDAILTVETIRKTIEQLKAENRIGLAVVDYLQLVTPSNPQDIREQQVAGVANGLRAVAKDTRVPIVALSQLNEDGKVRESRVISHSANIVIDLHSLDGRDGDPEMRVVKGRRVRLANYNLVFDAQYCRIKSASPITDEDIPSGPKRPYSD